MKTLLRFIFVSVLGLSVLSCYDDSAIRETLNDHGNQIEQLNSNVEALKTLIEAVEGSDYITSVKPLKEDGVEVGYVITFAEAGKITIYHGKDSAAGKDDEDGNDGSSNAGNNAGANVSDNGEDCIFSKVYESEGYVYFVLTDDTVYKVPMAPSVLSATGLDIVFDVEQGTPIVPGGQNCVYYTVIGGDENTLVRALCNFNRASVYVDTFTPTTGRIFIDIDDYGFNDTDGRLDPDRNEDCFRGEIDGFTYEERYHNDFSILVSVSDGKNNSILKSLNFTEGILSVYDYYELDGDAGSITVNVTSNVEYKVVVPEDVTWLRYMPGTRSELRLDELQFEFDANDTGSNRSTWVDLLDSRGYWLSGFRVVQEAEPLVKIDGDFSDWDNLDESQVAVSTCDPEANWTALKTMKVYVDANAVYVLLEFDPDQIWVRDWVPVHIFLDADSDDATGGYGDQYTTPTMEWCLEGAIYAESEFCSYDAMLYHWTGMVGDSGWCWDDCLYNGFTSGAGYGDKYEIAIHKELCQDIQFAVTFGIGVDIQQNWMSVGVLPNAACTDDNPYGLAPLLRVYTNL